MLASAAAAKAAPRAEALPAPAAVTGEAVELGHPLLARRMPSAPGREVYETVFRVETHWVLDDHRILGNPVIAGTTYLEMVRAAFAGRTQHQDLEISDVYFLTPLSVRLGDQRIARLELTDEPGGRLYHWLDDAARFVVYPSDGETGLVRIDGQWSADAGAAGRTDS